MSEFSEFFLKKWGKCLKLSEFFLKICFSDNGNVNSYKGLCGFSDFSDV